MSEADGEQCNGVSLYRSTESFLAKATRTSLPRWCSCLNRVPVVSVSTRPCWGNGGARYCSDAEMPRQRKGGVLTSRLRRGYGGQADLGPATARAPRRRSFNI